MIERQQTLSLTVFGALPAVVLAGLVACGGGGGSDLQETGIIQFRVKRHLGENFTAQQAEATITFAGTGPSSGTGAGTIDLEDEDKTATVDSGGDVEYSHLFTGLRAGSWTLSVSFDGWSATCMRTLAAVSQVNPAFTYGKSGCGDYPNFP